MVKVQDLLGMSLLIKSQYPTVIGNKFGVCSDTLHILTLTHTTHVRKCRLSLSFLLVHFLT